jgi:hypothetical protein
MRATCSIAALNSSPFRIAPDLRVAEFAGDGGQDAAELALDFVVPDD